MLCGVERGWCGGGNDRANLRLAALGMTVTCFAMVTVGVGADCVVLWLVEFFAGEVEQGRA